ncbi:MAG: transposase [Methylosarcina sp.]
MAKTQQSIPALIRQSLTDLIAFLQTQFAKLQQDIDDHIQKHPDLKANWELLTRIPAVGPQVGNHLLSVMHNHSFQSAEQRAAYLGLVPVKHQSGTLLGRPRLSKAGPPRIRAVLFMAAVVGTQYNPHLKALYLRLQARGKTKMATLSAIMRKLVHLCFDVLKTRQPYQPDYGISA